MIDLSIVIVNWNTRDLLSDCLNAVYQGTKDVTCEVFVVDNASADGSGEMVAEKFPTIRLIRNTDNLGFAQANNQALRLAQGRHVLLLNPDTIVLDNALELMVAFLDKNPQVGAVGCRVLNADGTLQPSCRDFPDLLRLFAENFLLWESLPPNRFLGCFFAKYSTHDRVRAVDYVVGCCLMVRGEVVEKVGLLDERFFLYWEEVDWCYRMHQAGWRVCFLPQARVIHLGGRSLEPDSPQAFIHLHESASLFLEKHYSPEKARLLRLLLQGGLLVRVVAWSLLRYLPAIGKVATRKVARYGEALKSYRKQKR